MAITISNIAAAAQVSEATVSRVINGNTNIAPDTVQQVRSVMEELGYRPRRHRLRKQHVDFSQKQLHMAAFLVPDSREEALHTNLSSGTIYGIEDALYEHDASLVATHLRDDGKLPPCIEKQQVDGMIIRGGKIEEPVLSAIKNYPTVWVYQSGTPPFPCDQVSPDNEAMGHKAFDFLQNKGCRNMLFLNPADNHPSFHIRGEAFRISAKCAGIDAKEIYLKSGEYFADHLEEIKNHIDGVTGLFFCGLNFENDGHYVENLLINNGMTEDKGVFAILATHYSSRFPTIGVSPERVGREAAKQLIKRFENPGDEYRKVLLAPKVIMSEGAGDR